MLCAATWDPCPHRRGHGVRSEEDLVTIPLGTRRGDGRLLCDFRELGDAWGITRQGALKKWGPAIEDPRRARRR